MLPAVAGCWLVLPSFEALFVPENFRGAFAHYFTLMTPALLAFALINYGVNTAFQIAHRLSPLVIAALVAFLANFLALIFLPATAGRFEIRRRAIDLELQRPCRAHSHAVHAEAHVAARCATFSAR